MGHLLNYALVTSIYLAIGFLCYRFTLASARQHSFNRVALHCIVLLSLIMPLMHFSLPSASMASEPTAQQISGIEFELIPGGMAMEEKPMWPGILLWVYLSGCAVVLLWTVLSMLQIRRLVARGEKSQIKIRDVKASLAITDDSSIAPFSWWHSIVIGRADFESNGDTILIHEAGHIRHAHSADMMAYMLLLVFQWFNPAAWLIVDELRSVHEYQADSDVIESGADIRQYQMMLIKKAVGSRFPSPANSLNHSNLKNRITMMYKSRSSAARKAAALLVVPAMALAASVTHIPAVASVLSAASSATLVKKTGPADSDRKVSKNLQDMKGSDSEIVAEMTAADESATLSIQEAPASEESLVDATESAAAEAPVAAQPEATPATAPESGKEDIYVAVETQAEFPGGFPELMKWLAYNVRYPKEAHDNNTQGRVIIKFVIAKDGKITNPTIVRSVSPELDAEAIRVVSAMPTWKPAECSGKPVASYFTLPIAFRLQDEGAKISSEQSEPTQVTVIAFK